MKNNITSFAGDYRFLSNYYPCQVNLDGVVYPSVEHAYQAAKTLDTKERKSFHKHPLPTAGQAKRLGKRLALRKDWESVKLQIMEDLLTQKFAETSLRTRLLETGNDNLIEGNTWNDTFWGVCDGKGSNHLGKLLMKIRKLYETDLS